MVDLDPVVGFEIGGGKTRPVLVLSINSINRKPLVVSVVPGTSKFKLERDYANVVVVAPSRDNGLSLRTAFQCHQVRAIDHLRFRSVRVGQISSVDLARIEAGVRFSLGLGVDPR
jgi:mRNA interferase MazF